MGVLEFLGGALIWKFNAFAMGCFGWLVLRSLINSEEWETAALLSHILNSVDVRVVINRAGSPREGNAGSGGMGVLEFLGGALIWSSVRLLWLFWNR